MVRRLGGGAFCNIIPDYLKRDYTITPAINYLISEAAHPQMS